MTDSLITTLHGLFRQFQIFAKQMQDRVEETQMPMPDGFAEEHLEAYSQSMCDAFRADRDALRQGSWDLDPAVQQNHDNLCICLAVWELVHEVAVSSAPSAPRLLRWYNRHYLEEEIAKWWQEAQQRVVAPGAVKQGSPLWQPLYRLALADCHDEVLSLLRRLAPSDDEGLVGSVADFLATVPSLQVMEVAGATRSELNLAMREIQEAARRLLQDAPPGHPTRTLLRIYAGCKQSEFEAGEDIAAELGRSWIEDFVYAHAWVLPDLRRHELGDLLRLVAKRRTTEQTDDIDAVFFAALSLDVPGLLRALDTDQVRFPPIFTTHLVDVLYYGGRVSLAAEAAGDEGPMPVRDRHLLRYAKELYDPRMDRPRAQRHMTVDYLRAGGAEAVAKELERVAGGLCASAETNEEMEAAVTLLADLDLAGKIGAEQCWRKAKELRDNGDVAGCLRWAGLAEQYAAPARGCHVSDMLDSLAEDSDELERLMEALTPADPLAESLDMYPPKDLIALFASSVSSSQRLYFFVQYARCRALREAGRPAQEYVPLLVRLLASGMAGPAPIAKKILEELLLPLLSEDPALLSAEDVMALMRYVQGLSADPLERVRLGEQRSEVQRTLGDCLSAAILRGPGLGGGGGVAARGAWTAPAQPRGVVA